MTPEELLQGQVLLVDKPLGWSSFQAVNKLKYTLKNRTGVSKFKIGHAGTLDPLATGLLVVCTGKMTKRIHEFQDAVKEYTGTIVLGATTPSFDLETAVNEHFPVEHINEAYIVETTKQFIGEIQQVPPVFSAIKKEGVRLYEHARAGETVHIEPRTVTIYEFEITACNLPDIQFRVVCSKGTYIRSLANDFGKALQSGAHLSALRRTAIGSLKAVDAHDPTWFEQDNSS
jgi:tRNA pseudouridine55 synthase